MYVYMYCLYEYASTSIYIYIYIYIYDVSTDILVNLLPALVLDCQPHHNILDLCAAPGYSTVTLVNRGSTFASRRSNFDLCLGGQREARESSLRKIQKLVPLFVRVKYLICGVLRWMCYGMHTRTIAVSLVAYLYCPKAGKKAQIQSVH